MRIARQHPALLDGSPLGVAVVIDVLRATSTATVFASRGVEAIGVVATLDVLARLPPARGGYLVVSELEGADEAAGSSARIDNSPVTAAAVELAGRTPVLVTTNGTRALAAAAPFAERILVASFLNLGAVVDAIARLGPPLVTLLPAGHFGRREQRLEDELCADALAQRLRGEPVDTTLLDRIRADERVQRRLAREPGLDEDIALCLTPDRHPVALEFRAEGPERGWIRPIGG